MSPGPGEPFRDPQAVARLVADIGRAAPARTVRLMHVCGTHENALCEFGLRALLPPSLRLVAGPGCPVCVCPAAEIDMAVRLALEHGATVATFGDVVRVPARVSLMDAKARGADVRVVYGIDDAVRLAAASPGRQVVFFAVGFETTACTTAAALAAGVPANFSVLCSHRLVPPALDALVAIEGGALDGFLLPGHVSVVIGAQAYRPLAAARPGLPMVVAGFEPVDLLLGLRWLARAAAEGRGGLENLYPRSVREEGNRAARRLVGEVFEPVDAAWRGVGAIPASGLRLRGRFADHDAARRFGVTPDPGLPDTHPACRCGEVLLGRVEPEECALFGAACLPETPVGPCMVAFEGTCHARLRARAGWS